jgi:putative flippase GtrA
MLHPKSRRIVGFIFSGLVATGVHLLVAWLLVTEARWHMGSANSAAFCAATVVSYVLNSVLSFQAPMNWRTLLRFALVACVCASLSGALGALGERAQYSLYAVTGFIVLFVTPVSYLLHRHWTYRDQTVA